MSRRSQSILGALGTGLILKISGAALNVLAVPIALHILGEKTYAAFTAILGFAGWLALGSSGIGSLTAMTTAASSDDEPGRDRFWQAVISNGLGVGAVAALLIFPFHFFTERLVRDIPPESIPLLRVSAYYCFVALALTAACVAFEGRYIGLLRSGYCNMVRMTGQLLALFTLITVVPLYPNMLTVTVALTLGPLTAALWFIGRGICDTPPPAHFRYDVRESFFLVWQGAAYLAGSLAIMFYGGGSLPLFAIAFGQEQLATAGVIARIVLLYLSLTSIFVIPVAAALKQAIAAGEIVWVHRALFAALSVMMTGAAAVALLMFVFGHRLIKIWAGVELPALDDWIAPLAVIIVISGWYHIWMHVCFAFEGALPVAFCVLCEIATISFTYIALGRHLQQASSLWIMAAAMLVFSGTILPFKVLRRLRQLKV